MPPDISDAERERLDADLINEMTAVSKALGALEAEMLELVINETDHVAHDVSLQRRHAFVRLPDAIDAIIRDAAAASASVVADMRRSPEARDLSVELARVRETARARLEALVHADDAAEEEHVRGAAALVRALGERCYRAYEQQLTDARFIATVEEWLEWGPTMRSRHESFTGDVLEDLRAMSATGDLARLHKQGVKVRLADELAYLFAELDKLFAAAHAESAADAARDIWRRSLRVRLDAARRLAKGAEHCRKELGLPKPASGILALLANEPADDFEPMPGEGKAVESEPATQSGPATNQTAKSEPAANLTAKSEPPVNLTEAAIQTAAYAAAVAGKPVQQAAEYVAEAASKPVHDAAEQVAKATEPVKQGAAQAAEAAGTPFQHAAEKVVRAAEPLQQAGEAAGKPVQHAAEKVSNATAPVKHAAEQVMNATNSAKDTAKQAVERAAEATDSTKQTAEQAANAATKPFKQAAEQVAQATDSAKETSEQAAERAAEATSSAKESAKQTAVQAAAAVTEPVKETAAQMAVQAGEQVAKATDSVKQAAAYAADKVTEHAKPAEGTVDDCASEPAEAIKQAGEATRPEDETAQPAAEAAQPAVEAEKPAAEQADEPTAKQAAEPAVEAAKPAAEAAEQPTERVSEPATETATAPATESANAPEAPEKPAVNEALKPVEAMFANSVATMILQRMQKNGELGDDPQEKALKIFLERLKRQQAEKQAATNQERLEAHEPASESSEAAAATPFTSSTYQPAATSTTDAAQAHKFSSAVPKTTAHDEL